MLMYMRDFDDIMMKIREIEKASSENFGEESDNA